MGNKCGAEGRPCHYYIYANAPIGSAEDKQNRLLNYLVGLTTTEDLINEVEGRGLSPPWNLAYPLIFPPALETIYSLNSNMTKGSSGQIDPTNTNQCYAIPNPYYRHALELQNAMAGVGVINHALPCSKAYNVPFSLNNDIQHFGNVVFETIQNDPVPAGGGYNACWDLMKQTILEVPQTLGNEAFCIGDPAFPTYTQGTSYSYDLITGPNFIGYAAGVEKPPPLLEAFLNDPANNLNNMFPPHVPFGPYEVTTQQPCSNINDPNCTYTICKSQSVPTGYLCQTGGKCNPTYSSIPPPPFKTKDECTSCWETASCGGTNVCCPQSQTGGTCSSTPPPPPSPGTNFVMQAAIGLIVFFILLVIIFFGVRALNKKIKS